MRKILLLLLVAPLGCPAANSPDISTADIDQFWSAYDQLASAKSRQDSIRIIQEQYLDRATDHMIKFVKLRDFTAEKYADLILHYPGFWKSIRPLTENIKRRKNEINSILDQLALLLPNFRRPDVCFGIGCLQSGGTTSKNLILIGSEIAAADATVDTSGLNPWLRSVLGNTGDIVAMVAHEAVHTQQSGIPLYEIFTLIKHRKLRLLNMCVIEGSADFVTLRFLNLNINSRTHTYGNLHRCELSHEFENTIDHDPFNYSGWLYNGLNSAGRPADLGYFVGCEISARYYDRSENKEKALRTLLRRGKYKKVYRNSGYGQHDCS
jgi:hypothetical protein